MIRPEIGDRVRVKRHYGHPHEGEEGIVVDVFQMGMGGVYIKIKLDSGVECDAHISVVDVIEKAGE